MIRLLILAIIAAVPAWAGPLDYCRAMLPDGQVPIYREAPARHTELCRHGYVVSHDDAAHEPRWVAWLLTAEHLRLPHVARTNDFRADPDLPPGAGARVADYRGSGYDMGHMSDAEDQAWSADTEHESFLLSDIIPQCPPCNRAAWRYLEDWTRAQAMRLGAVYVLAGPVFGTAPKTIGPDRVIVPMAAWRLIVAGAQRWAFIVPNEADQLRPGADVAPYETTVEAVEDAAGLTLRPED